MKKFLSVFLLMFFCLVPSPCFCQETEIPYKLTAYKLSNQEAIDENIDYKLAKEFIPIKLLISNNSLNHLNFLGDSYYTNKGTKYNTPQNAFLYQKTRRHLILRAIIWGVLGAGPLSFIFVPASMSHTYSKNDKLKSNVNRNNLRKHLLFPNEKFMTYAFLPKKHKKADSITLKFSSDNKPIKLTSPIVVEEF